MQTYDARLASFKASRKVSKKTLKWPHKQPSPPDLARAGFYYQPSTASPDNVTCYLCDANLDGWEAEDDPISEHLKHMPDCGWANVVFIERMVEAGNRDIQILQQGNPVEARRMTFESRWPHEDKRGWVCKISKMVQAGWYYCPTPESDDYAKCAYCSLSLDGWEPKDDPFAEHLKRSPDCLFLGHIGETKNTKASQGRKKRASKASRMSTQSTMSMLSDGLSMAETDIIESSVLSIQSTKPSKTTKGSKKGSKTEKAAKTSKAQESLLKGNQSTMASSFVEPEDDDFEVKVVPNEETARGKKRASGESLDDDNDNHQTKQPPQKKRRGTKAERDANAREDAKSIPAEVSKVIPPQDTAMADADEESNSQTSAAKKTGKNVKAKGKAAKRKDSAVSVASKASLRVGEPNDENSDAALVEGLDRPLTDHGSDSEESEIENPKTRRTTRNAGRPKVAASTASTRRNTRAGSAMIDESTLNAASMPAIPTESTDMDSQSLLLPKAKKQGTRKASSKKKAGVGNSEPNSTSLDPDNTTINPAPKRQVKKRTASRQKTGQTQLADQKESHDTEAINDQAAESIGAQEAESTDSVQRVKQSIRVASLGGPAQSEASVKQTASVAPEELPTSSVPIPPTRIEVIAKASKSMKQPKKTSQSEDIVPIKKLETVGTSIQLDPEQYPDIGTPSSPPLASGHSTPGHVPSPQSSDAENQPPSSRPARTQPPLSLSSPSRQSEVRIPLANITPTASPSRGNRSTLRSALPWSAMDIESMFQNTPGPGDENRKLIPDVVETGLSSPEKKLTVEAWIKSNAEKAEERLRNDCERLVGKFEGEGVRALRTLEGIVCVD